MNLTYTHMRYLLAIYKISHVQTDISSASVARLLQVSKPSVSRMLSVLVEKQLIVKKPYGKIHLTHKGMVIAKNFEKKIRLLMELIPKMELELTIEETDKAAYALACALPNRTWKTICQEQAQHAG